VILSNKDKQENQIWPNIPSRRFVEGPGGGTPQTQDRIEVTRDQSPANGFQHSSQERKSILKGNFIVNAASSQGDVCGTSTASHRIKSAVHTSTNAKYLVYVGKLAAKTTSDDVHCHLSDVGINNVNDVINLNYGNTTVKERSFCISLGDEMSMVNLFNGNMWPSGVIVRPFRPARPNRHRYGRTNGRQQNYRQREGGNRRRPFHDRRDNSFQRRTSRTNRGTDQYAQPEETQWDDHYNDQGYEYEHQYQY
jgi:hypothetical protein